MIKSKAPLGDYRQNPDISPHELSLFDLAQMLVFKEGWDRKLMVELLPPGGLVQIRRRSEDRNYSETDIVGNYSVADYLAGKISREMLRYDCRRFLLQEDLP